MHTELDSNDFVDVFSSSSSDLVDLTGDDEIDSIRVQSSLVDHVEPFACGDVELGGDREIISKSSVKGMISKR
ncbi:hypothetical protein ACJIZ3_011247 [Penstemon smallii]|uniref:Uncharacterized protein n=1 Tax=Penstemon smallii TaxID=265156 RepID=A0ABD3UIZ5_9LAMI